MESLNQLYKKELECHFFYNVTSISELNKLLKEYAMPTDLLERYLDKDDPKIEIVDKISDTIGCSDKAFKKIKTLKVLMFLNEKYNFAEKYNEHQYAKQFPELINNEELVVYIAHMYKTSAYYIMGDVNNIECFYRLEEEGIVPRMLNSHEHIMDHIMKNYTINIISKKSIGCLLGKRLPVVKKIIEFGYKLQNKTDVIYTLGFTRDVETLRYICSAMEIDKKYFTEDLIKNSTSLEVFNFLIEKGCDYSKIPVNYYNNIKIFERLIELGNPWSYSDIDTIEKAIIVKCPKVNKVLKNNPKLVDRLLKEGNNLDILLRNRHIRKRYLLLKD